MKSLSKSNIYLASLGIFVGTFALTFLVSSSFVPIENSNADVVRIEQTSDSYTASISSADNIVMDLHSTPTGATAIVKDTIKTITNSPNGYKLYLSSTESDSKLYKDGNSTSSYFISPATGTFTAPDILSENQWGFNLATESGEEPAVFAAVPGKSEPQLIQTATSATPNSGNDLDIYYATKTTTALPSGTYTGHIRYTITTDASLAELDVIALYPNVAETGMEIIITTPLYSNYNFSNSEISVSFGDTVCPIDSISTETGAVTIKCIAPQKPQGIYDVIVSVPGFSKTFTLASGITYYEVPEFFKITMMQEMTSDICASATTPSITAASADTTGLHSGDDSYVPQHVLYDIRDGNSYRVRKLADGNCWMTENLRLILNTETTLTAEDSDVSEEGWTPNKNTETVAGELWGEGDSWSDTSKITDEELNTSRSYDNSAKIVTNTSGDKQSAGVYYNFYAATAGSGSTEIEEYADALHSVCPKGWGLQSRYAAWELITNTYKVNTVTELQAFPLSYALTGYYYWYQGRVNMGSGNWWSLRADDHYTALRTYLTYDSISAINRNPRAYGFSIRCINK